MDTQAVAAERIPEIVYRHHWHPADTRLLVELVRHTTQSVLDGLRVPIFEKRREELQRFELRAAIGICDRMAFIPVPRRFRSSGLAV